MVRVADNPQDRARGVDGNRETDKRKHMEKEQRRPLPQVILQGIRTKMTGMMVDRQEKRRLTQTKRRIVGDKTIRPLLSRTECEETEADHDQEGEEANPEDGTVVGRI